MKQNESIEHVLENMDRNLVYKTKGSPIFAISLIVAGVFLFAVYASFEWKPTDSLPHFMFVLGAVFAICGVLLFFFRKSFFVCVENQQKITKSECYFHVSEMEKLVSLFESGDLTGIKNLKPSISDGLKIRLMSTGDGRFCLSQVVAYINHEYANLTEVRQHAAKESNFLKDYLRERKS